MLKNFLSRFNDLILLSKVCNIKQLRYYQRLGIKPQYAVKVLLKHYKDWRADLAIQDIWKTIIKELWT